MSVEVVQLGEGAPEAGRWKIAVGASAIACTPEQLVEILTKLPEEIINLAGLQEIPATPKSKK